VAQLKEAIDRGEGADKVSFPDPAASPLGTDAEAGGAPPAQHEVRQAIAAETGRRGTPVRAPGGGALPLVLGFIALIAVSILLTVLIMASL
jgi:hypothetical protein